MILQFKTDMYIFQIWHKYILQFSAQPVLFKYVLHSTAARAAAYIAVFAAAVASWQRMCCCTLPPPTSRHTWTLFTLLHISSLQHLYSCIFAHLITCSFENLFACTCTPKCMLTHLLTCTLAKLQAQLYACRLANTMEHISVHFKEAVPWTKHRVLLNCNAWYLLHRRQDGNREKGKKKKGVVQYTCNAWCIHIKARWQRREAKKAKQDWWGGAVHLVPSPFQPSFPPACQCRLCPPTSK